MHRLIALLCLLAFGCTEADARPRRHAMAAGSPTSFADAAEDIPDDGVHPDAAAPDAASDAGFANSASILFDGVDEVITIADSAALTSATQFTVAIWIDYVTNTTDDIFVGKTGASTTREWSIRQDSVAGDLRFGVGTSASNYLRAVGANLVVGTWGHFCCQFDGSQADNATRARCWDDGVELTGGNVAYVGTIPASVNDTTANLVLGGSSAGTNFANAYLDEFVYFDALVDCTALYNSGTPGDIFGATDLIVWVRGDNGDTETTFINHANPGTHNGASTTLEAGDLQGNIPP